MCVCVYACMYIRMFRKMFHSKSNLYDVLIYHKLLHYQCGSAGPDVKVLSAD